MVDKLISEHDTQPEEAERLARLSRGCFGWALTALAEASGLMHQREEELDRLAQVSQSGLDTRFAVANEMATLFYQDRSATSSSGACRHCRSGH